MIIDVHTHCWPGLHCFSPSFRADARRMRAAAVELANRYEDYRDSTGGEEVVAVVFGGKARLSGIDCPITTLAESVVGLRRLCDVRIDRFSIPREQVESLIQRDVLGLLGLPDPRRAGVAEVRP